MVYVDETTPTFAAATHLLLEGEKLLSPCVYRQFATYTLVWTHKMSNLLLGRDLHGSFSQEVALALEAAQMWDKPTVRLLHAVNTPVLDHAFSVWRRYDLSYFIELLNVLLIEFRGVSLSCKHIDETARSCQDCVHTDRIFKYYLVPEHFDSLDVLMQIMKTLVDLTKKKILVILDCTNLDRRRDEFDFKDLMSVIVPLCRESQCEHLIVFSSTIPMRYWQDIDAMIVRSFEELRYVQAQWVRTFGDIAPNTPDSVVYRCSASN